MQLLKNEKIVIIMEKTLNHVDARLMDHGKRVAYLMYKVLSHHREYDDKKLRNICILSMLHDVGAYKTEEIDKMVIFESLDVWEHSIYGFLFIKYFSPLKNLAPVVLYHHAECNEITTLDDPEMRTLAQLISLCDRADVFSLHHGNNDKFVDYINKNRNIKYFDDIVDMYLSSGINIENVFDSMDTDKEFDDIFHNTPQTADEVNGYLNMIMYSIDFRSSQTVIHTVSATCVAGVLAEILGANEKQIEIIKTGAMLHDIGKIGIPSHILESKSRLNDSEMDIMRTHVDIAEEILDGNVDDEVMYIAIKHHEKLNGTGYPRNLEVSEISFFDRIVAIADIFSALCGVRSYKNEYPKERVIRILGDMSDQNLLDPYIVSITIDNYEKIVSSIEIEAGPVFNAYESMNNEYLQIRKNLANGNSIEGDAA